MLVLGGAASGKSAFAEKLCGKFSLSPVYIATANAYDAEMAEKISLHRQRRGPAWETVEAPQDLTKALRTINVHQVCLLDCLTMWLTNRMLAEADLQAESEALTRALADSQGPVVVVSNEVGHGIVPDNALGRRFREAQGRLNIKVAEVADTVVFVTAGLPQVLKGELP